MTPQSNTQLALRHAVLSGGLPLRPVIVIQEEAGEYVGVVWERDGEVRTVCPPEAPEIERG